MGLFAALLLLMLAVTTVGVAANFGVIVAQRRYAQTAADASALAGADFAGGTVGGGSGCDTGSTYTLCAQGYAQNNGFINGAGGAVVTVNQPPTDSTHCPATTGSQSDSRAVQVCISKPVPVLRFGAITGTSNTIYAHAIATTTLGPTKCVVCVLDPTAPNALDVSGNGNVRVCGGSIAVDSNQDSAVAVGGNGSISDYLVSGGGSCSGCPANCTADAVAAVGTGCTGATCCSQTSGNATITPKATCNIAPFTDPLAGLQPPTSLGLTNQGSVNLSSNNSATISPGIYSSINVSGNAQLTLHGGVYVIKGGTFTSSGNAVVIGTAGVTIYLACANFPTPCTTGQQGATLSLAGNSTLSAPQSGAYKGLAIFADPNNTHESQGSPGIMLAGNAGNGLTGTVYAKSFAVTVSGNATDTLNSAFLVDSLTLAGNGSFFINFNPLQNIPFSQPSGASLTE